MHKNTLENGDEWSDQRAVEYLQNFWEPKLGSQMLYDGDMKPIVHIEKEYPDQILLEGDTTVHFVQDLEWAPSMSEVFDIFKNLGIRVHEDSISYNRIFKGKPTTLVEAAQILVDLRVISMSQNTAMGL